MNISKILMMSGKGVYSHVFEDKENQELNVDTRNHGIPVSSLSPYGFQFDFQYLEERNISKSHLEQKNNLLEKAVEDLNQKIKDAEADYILVNSIHSRIADSHFFEIKGKAQLLIDNKMTGSPA